MTETDIKVRLSRLVSCLAFTLAEIENYREKAGCDTDGLRAHLYSLSGRCHSMAQMLQQERIADDNHAS